MRAAGMPSPAALPDDRPMQDFRRAFLDLALSRGVLRFGEFTLKSGRLSPYFFNAGGFDSGAALDAVGGAYAEAAVAAGLGFDMLFGPAYKGIPLATTMACALATRHGRDVPVAFNRKEAKDHGEGGTLIGAPLAGRVLIVDDVISAGTSVRESVDLIRGAGATPAGVVIAVDRQERGTGERSAADEVREALGLPVVAIATLDDILELSRDRADLARFEGALRAYRDAYGVASARAR
jgi:orotate phosphoribosyltransferase